MASQFQRRQPESWGQLQRYDTESEKFVESGWQLAFDYNKDYPETPTESDLRAGALPELSFKYTLQIQYDWRKCVINYAANMNVDPC